MNDPLAHVHGIPMPLHCEVHGQGVEEDDCFTLLFFDCPVGEAWSAINDSMHSHHALQSVAQLNQLAGLLQETHQRRDDLMDQYHDAWTVRQASQDRIHRAFTQFVRDMETYAAPDGSRQELPSGFDYLLAPHVRIPAAQNDSQGRHLVGRLRCTLVGAGLCLAALALGNGYASTMEFTWLPGDWGSGWVGTAHGAGATSAQREYVRAMQVLSGIFDGPPTFWGVVSDRSDTIAQMPFLGVWRGTRIAGIAVASVQGERSTIGVAFDDASLAPFTMDGLVRQLGQHVPLIAPPEALQPVVWERFSVQDGSGHVSVPSGWRVTHAGEGSVELAGPRGEAVALGFRQFPFLPEMGFWMPGVIVAPYQDPVSAIQMLWPTLIQGLGGTVGRVLHYTGYPSQYGEQSAMILWEEYWHGRPFLAYGYVNTHSSAPTWMFYLSAVRAPTEVFGESFPTMLGIWSSWEIDPQVHWQRMQSAMRTMAETSDILHETIRDTARRREARMYDWAEAYRGSAIVRDTRTGEEAPADLAFVQETVDGLNQVAGYAAYEHVPLREWWQGR